MVQSATTTAPPATLSFQNRGIVEFHATVLSRTPAMRAATAERILHDLVGQRRLGPVSVRAVEQIMVVSVGTLDLFPVVPADAPLLGEPLENTARRAAAALQTSLDEAIELRTPRLVALGVGLSLLATALLALLLRLVRHGHGVLVAATARRAERQLQKLPVGEVVRASRLPELLRTAVTVVSGAVGVFFVYTWLTFVLNRFPYSRPWGEALRGFLLERTSRLGMGILGAIPNLFSVLLIVIVTRFVVKLAVMFFEGVEHGRIVVPWLYAETAPTTRRLVTVLLWLFAAAMAYPYLPGSHTDAFKGISVFVGLMVSLGSSGLVNQLMSGLMIDVRARPATRRFRPHRRHRRNCDAARNALDQGKDPAARGGDDPERRPVLDRDHQLFAAARLGGRVRAHVADDRIRRALATGARAAAPGRRAHDRNPPAAGAGRSADRSAWFRRRVHADGLGGGPDDARTVLDVLHANIQDAFNEFGVQIMSPAYETDPAGPKIVPREKWFAAPAAAPHRQDE